MSWQQFVEINGIRRRFADASLENFIGCQQFRDLAEEFIIRPHSWILTGKAGRGKTYFSYCLLRLLVESRGISSVRWMKSKVLDDRIVKEMKDYGSAAYFISTLCESPYLFIDDFGVDRDTERSQRDYYEILDNRWEDYKPTIITTNLGVEDIEKLYGERILSRFKDSKWSIFDGPDLRGVYN